ncbi:hypothetical protein [Micromonospora psammae]|uniref:hypothetical protein n=1 Tax=Micromonospora sp. CPCC 205556 TaxID=3122398 RepID=UPI002FF10E89
MRHPSERPLLPGLMLLSLCLAGVSSTAGAGFAVVVFLAIFLVFFGVWWLGWLLRGHELWREERRRRN